MTQDNGSVAGIGKASKDGRATKATNSWKLQIQYCIVPQNNAGGLLARVFLIFYQSKRCLKPIFFILGVFIRF